MNNGKNLGKLDWVSPIHIKRSEENPRSDEFYKDKDYLRLRESVAKYGVIVPIIIKRLSKEENKIRYQLVDGERRWKAAIDTNQSTIPAYVLPPEKEINILTTMFQIHMNQEGWSAIEQAKALEAIITTLKNKIVQKYQNEEEIEKELLKQLKEITGMDDNTALSRIRFFRWPEKLREYVYNNAEKNYYSYAVEIEDRIVEPILRNFPDISEKLAPDKIREALFTKVTGGHVSRAEEIRDAAILTKRRSDKKDASKAKSLLLQFINNKSFTFPEAREQYLYIFPEETKKPPLSLRRLINIIRTLVKALNEYAEPTVKKLKPKQKRDLESALGKLTSAVENLTKRLKL